MTKKTCHADLHIATERLIPPPSCPATQGVYSPDLNGCSALFVIRNSPDDMIDIRLPVLHHPHIGLLPVAVVVIFGVGEKLVFAHLVGAFLFLEAFPVGLPSLYGVALHIKAVVGIFVILRTHSDSFQPSIHVVMESLYFVWKSVSCHRE